MKFTRIIALMLALALSVCALASCTPANNDPKDVYVISGPTGVGAVSMMEKSKNNQTEGKYNFVLAENQEKAKAAFLNG